MKIAIIGSGNMGRGVGNLWTRAGYDVIFSDAFMSDEQLAQVAANAGESASFATAQDATAQADVVMLTVRWAAIEEAITSLGDVNGKIILSTVNALKQDLTGLELGTTTSAAEEIARLAPAAHVVECVLPFAEVLHSESRDYNGDKSAVFYCGDDEDARATVKPLIEALGLAAIDAGPLYAARYIEPAAMLLVHLAYNQGMGGQIGYKLLER